MPGDDVVTIFTNIWKDKWTLVDYFKHAADEVPRKLGLFW